MSRLTNRQLRRLAWASWWFFIVGLLGSTALVLVLGEPFSLAAAAEAGLFLLVLVAFPLAGLMILRQEPRNTVGWLLMAIGCTWGIGGYVDAYAYLALVGSPGSLPGGGAAAALAILVWAPALGLTGTFLFLVFPDGHLPTRRWRPVAWFSATVLVVLTLALLLSPGELEEGPGAGLVNPLGVAALGPALAVALELLVPTFAVCVLASATALVVRFRRSRGIERLQLKWLATASAMVGLTFGIGIAASLLASGEEEQASWLSVIDQLSFLVFALPPISIGFAVLRYRLYDIDVVVNRALVYGSLTACLAAVYLTSVLMLQIALQPLTERSDLAVAASTLTVAALFRPLRAHIQSSVDRRFYRRKYDGAQALDAFTGRLRHEVDLDAVGVYLLAAVRETVQPRHASVWLAGPRRSS